MIDNNFIKFFNQFVRKYKTDVFNNIPKCKSLILDLAKGEHKNEIRLLFQAFELDCHTVILKSKDLNLTRLKLIKQLQNDLFINEDIATSLIDLLLLEIRNFTPIVEKEKKSILTSINPFKKNKKQAIINNNTSPTQKQSTINPVITPVQNQPVIKPSTSPTQNQSQPTVNNSSMSIINSMISLRRDDEVKMKELRIEFLNNVCRPVFTNYYKLMNENKLECKFKIDYAADFEFSFIKQGNGYRSSPSYMVSFYYDKDKKIQRIFTSIRNIELYNIGNNSKEKYYDFNSLNKEIILKDLSDMTEKIINIMKDKNNHDWVY